MEIVKLLHRLPEIKAMKRFFYPFYILLSCLSFWSVASWTSAQEPILILEGVESAAGEFEQIIREQDGYVVDRQTGSFVIQRPRQLRWQIAELDQLLISDGEQLYLYDELFQQVVIRQWSSNPAQNPAAILLEENDLQEWARIEQQGQNYLLTPFEDLGSILEVHLSFSTDSQDFPEQLTILDATGQTTEIRFSEVQINGEHPDELFRFQIPADVEVLYE